MASRKSQFEQNSFGVTFEGGLQTSVRAEIINELIKYILYERQQIPLPIEQVKRELDQAKDQNGIKKGIYCRIGHKKATTVVTNLDKLSDQLRHVFHECPEIKQIAIVLGATSVSPKEVYMIELPPLAPEATNIELKPSLKTLFRQIMMHDPLRDMKTIPLTNMMVLLTAPRLSTCVGFTPKPSYKLPRRGHHFHFQLSCNHGCSVINQQDLSKDISTIDLSGFEPLENTYMDTSLGETSTGSNSPFSLSSFRMSFSKSFSTTRNSLHSKRRFSSETSDLLSPISDTSTIEQDSQGSEDLSAQAGSASMLKYQRLGPETGAFGDSVESSDHLGASYSSNLASDNNDLVDIWFQASITVKGYKYKK